MGQSAFDHGGNSFSGNGRPKPLNRLFFGVRPDPDTTLRIDQFRREFCEENNLAGKPRGRELLHISLHYLGDYAHLPSRIIYGARWACLAISMSPFEVSLNSIGSFGIAPSAGGKPAKHALVLLAEGAPLVEFQRNLGAELRKIGLRAGDHFRPHVTLLYGPNAVPQQSIKPIRFVVRDFALIHSMLGLSRHETIGRWPLIG